MGEFQGARNFIGKTAGQEITRVLLARGAAHNVPHGLVIGQQVLGVFGLFLALGHIDGIHVNAVSSIEHEISIWRLRSEGL